MASSTLEAKAALANINSNFALYKIEALQEYQQLGSILSTHRRDSAEVGIGHVTARKLNALFEQAIPDVPELVSMYGSRASEIAAKIKGDTEATKHHGLFAEHTGFDGTNIWAETETAHANYWKCQPSCQQRI